MLNTAAPARQPAGTGGGPDCAASMCHHCESVAWLVCTVITDSSPFTCPAPGPGSTEPKMEPTTPFVVQANVRLRVPLVPQSVHERLRLCACAIEATSAS